LVYAGGDDARLIDHGRLGRAEPLAEPARLHRGMFMRVIRLMVAGTVAAVLLLGSSTVVLGQEDARDESPQYFFGELEGFFHPDETNPHDCAIGITSDSMSFGQTELLGATTVRQVNCYVPTETLHNIQDAVYTITGESGDALTAIGSGDCIPDDVPEAGGFYSCWATITITGGTGVFGEASGEIHAIGYTWNTQSDHEDAAPGDTPARMLLEGLIEY
jgi:hypothetical protein